MSLHVETAGRGPDLVLLHGWGLHGGLFDEFAAQAQSHWRVHRVDLPGHGRSRDVADATLDGWLDAILDATPPGADWLGWSLGGLLALHAVSTGAGGIRRVLAVATTPRLLRAADWPHGVDAEDLARIAAGIEADFEHTVMNFLALQVHGDAHARTLLRGLRERAFAHGPPGRAALAAGLRILADTDLRAALDSIRIPVLAVGGGRDRLAAPAAVAHIADRVPRGQCEIFEHAAHAPFLSEPGRFYRMTEEFLGREPRAQA